MDRKTFVKKSLLGAAGLTAYRNATGNDSTYHKVVEQVGFNHLPNKEISMKKSVLHKANTRGHANHGWLNSHHSFSFANYRNPERMNFGVLRVLNDDIVAPSRGFGTHPHENMEIISIPLEGDLEHKDDMGNTTVIKKGDIQVMSAGTGVHHSEYNRNKDREVKFLQIWMFPNKQNVTPRYDQITLKNTADLNQLTQVLSPNPNDDGVWAHQNAWFHIGTFEKGHTTTYELKDKSNGVYAFILEGDMTIDGQSLNPKDGFGIWDIDKLELKADSAARILLMEVPMQLG